MPRVAIATLPWAYCYWLRPYQAATPQAIEASRKAVTEFRSRVLKFADSATSSFSHISKARDFSFASLVKVDHFLYKQNGYRVIHQGAA